MLDYFFMFGFVVQGSETRAYPLAVETFEVGTGCLRSTVVVGGFGIRKGIKKYKEAVF